jgi:hypothetical protein
MGLITYRDFSTDEARKCMSNLSIGRPQAILGILADILFLV